MACQIVVDAAQDHWAAVTRLGRRKLGMRQPQRLQYAVVKAAESVVGNAACGKAYAHERLSSHRLSPVVNARDGSWFHRPTRLFKGFAGGCRRQRFPVLEVAGRLVQDMLSTCRFLDHEKALVVVHDRGYGEMKFPFLSYRLHVIYIPEIGNCCYGTELAQGRLTRRACNRTSWPLRPAGNGR